MSGSQNPVDIKNIGKFEHRNNISLNEYGYEDKKIFPLRINTVTVARHHVNLLYITPGEKSHYVLVKEVSRLVLRQYNNDKNKKYFCQYCLHGCTSEEVLKGASCMGRKESSSQKLTTRRDVTKSNLQKQNTDYIYLLSSTRISKSYYVNKTRMSHRHQILHRPIPASCAMREVPLRETQ